MSATSKHASPLVEQKPAASGRLPQLAPALDRAGEGMAIGMARYFEAPPVVLFAGVEPTQIWDALARTGDGVVSALDAPGWEGRIAISLDGLSLDLLIEAMLGGEGDGEALTRRAASALDLHVAGALFAAAAEALREAFAPVAETDFVMERPSAAASPDTLFRRDGSALLAHYDIRSSGRTARLFVIIPVEALAAARTRLAREPEGAAPDPVWLAGLRARVGGADVRVRAVLDERVMTLGEIAAFRVGALLPLRPDAIARLALTCDGAPLFHGELGQAGGAYTVRVIGGCGETQDKPEAAEGESA